MALSSVLAILILQYSLVALVSSAGPPSGWKTLQGVVLFLLPFSLVVFTVVPILSSYLLVFVYLLTGYFNTFKTNLLSLVTAIIIAMNSHQLFYLRKKIRSKPFYFINLRVNSVCTYTAIQSQLSNIMSLILE